MKAPEVKGLIDIFRNSLNVCQCTKETYESLDKLFEELREIKKFKDTGKIDLWLCEDRGTPEDFANYEEWLEDGDVKNYDEFVEIWKNYFPDEIVWFKLTAIYDNGYAGLIYNFSNTIQFHKNRPIGHQDYTEIINWTILKIRDIKKELNNDTYNERIKEELPYKLRTGIISRTSLWHVCNWFEKNDKKNLTKEEIDKFVSFTKQQLKQDILFVQNMTAKKFFEMCSLCYSANNMNIEGLTPKEQYYKYADGRDAGLRDIDENSCEAFKKWITSYENGHPWEIIRGGNSTHIDLFVKIKDNNKYVISLAGLYRSAETIKSYIALSEKSIPVMLHNSEEMIRRIQGKDYVGIVPEPVFTCYCDGYFPNMKVIDFIHLSDVDDYNSLLPYIKWLPEKEIK